MPADMNRNLTDTIQDGNKIMRAIRKSTNFLWKLLWSTIRWTFFTVTGRELPEHPFQNLFKDTREKVGRELFSRERRREVELDGPTKNIVRIDYSDPTEGISFIQKLTQEYSGLKDRNGRAKPAPFVVCARDGNEKFELSTRQQRKLVDLQHQYEYSKEQCKKYEQAYASTRKNSDLKKYEKWSRQLEDNKQKLEQNHTYAICMKGGLSIYVNESRRNMTDKVKATVGISKDKEMVLELGKSMSKTLTQEKNMKEAFLKESTWSKEGLYGPLTREELGQNYYACPITQKEVQILQNAQDIQNKSFSILKDQTGKLQLLTPMSMEAVKELTPYMAKTGMKDFQFRQYRNGKLVERKPLNEMQMPVTEYMKLKENELPGTKYDQTFEFVNGELYTTLSDYTMPDGSKGINAMEHYAKEVEKNRDKSEYLKEQAREKEKQEEIADRPMFALRNENEMDTTAGGLFVEGNELVQETEKEPEHEAEEFDSGKGNMTRKEVKESKDRRQQVMGDTEITIDMEKTEELTYEE